MPISEELELDITSALDAIESLNQPLTELGANLTDTLTSAIEAVDVTPLVDQLATLDASGLTTTIDAAVNEADGIVPIEADTSGIPGEIDSSIAEADTTVTIDADTAEVGVSIDEALAAADTTVTVDADASGITADIEDAISGADTTIEIDTGDSAEGVQGLTDGLGGLQDELGLTQGATSLATGDIAGLSDGLLGLFSKIPGAGKVIAGGVAAVGGVVAGFTQQGLTAEGIFDRFGQVVGRFRDDVRDVNVGSLNTDLGDLAIKLGSTESALIDTSTTLFDYQKQAGRSGKESAAFANTITALGARAFALNPNLGSVEAASAGILASFTKSGKGAAKYGIALSKADIEQRAFANTGKTLVGELTPQEKAFAASQLGAEKYAGVLDKDITRGSKNAVIQQKSVTASIEDFIQKAGRPLVAPFLEILKSLIPVVKAVAPIFVTLGKAVLPIFAQTLKDLTPSIKLFGEIMQDLQPIIIPLVQSALKLVLFFTSLTKAVTDLIGGDIDIAGFFSGISDAIGSFLVTVVDFGGELIDNFLAGIQEAFPAVVSFFANLGPTIFNTIGDVLFTIVQKGTDLITGLFTGITSAAVAVFTFFTNLAGTVFDTIGDVVGTLVQKGSDFIGGLLSGIVDKATEVFDFFTGLPGRIVTTVGNVASSLFRAGVDLIQGLIDGIVDKAGDIVGILKKKVTDVIPGFIKSALGIGSPSKVLAGIGSDIGAGLIQGMDSSLSGIKSASASMVAAALPIPGVGALPAVAAALPVSAGSAAASTAGFTSSAQASLQGAGSGVNIQQLIVQTTAKDQTQVGIEVARQLRAESFRAGR